MTKRLEVNRLRKVTLQDLHLTHPFKDLVPQDLRNEKEGNGRQERRRERGRASEPRHAHDLVEPEDIDEAIPGPNWS